LNVFARCLEALRSQQNLKMSLLAIKVQLSSHIFPELQLLLNFLQNAQIMVKIVYGCFDYLNRLFGSKLEMTFLYFVIVLFLDT
jgi:hypothetical protein